MTSFLSQPRKPDGGLEISIRNSKDATRIDIKTRPDNKKPSSGSRIKPNARKAMSSFTAQTPLLLDAGADPTKPEPVVIDLSSDGDDDNDDEQMKLAMATSRMEEEKSWFVVAGEKNQEELKDENPLEIIRLVNNVKTTAKI